jgi:hypothetical protein
MFLVSLLFITRLGGRRLAAGTLLAVLAVTGSLAARAATGQAVPPDQSSVTDMSPITYSAIGTARSVTPTSSDSPEGIVASSLAAMGQTLVLSANLSHDASAPDATYSLNAVVAATDPSGGAVEGVWEASLLAGTVKDELTAAGYSELYNVAVTLRLPDGSNYNLGSFAVHGAADGQKFDSPSADLVRAQAKAMGLNVADVSTIPGLDGAVRVVIVASADSETLKNATDIADALLGQRYEGSYFEIRNDSGAILAISASSLRTGIGQVWQDPAVRGGFMHSGFAATGASQ